MLRAVVCALVVALASPNETAGQSNDGGQALYEQGESLKQEGKYTEAAAAYQTACEGGYALACSELAVMYRDGAGVVKDESRAVEFFRQACDRDYAPGCEALERTQRSVQQGIWEERNGRVESLYEQGDYAEAALIGQEALRLAEESFGP